MAIRENFLLRAITGPPNRSPGRERDERSNETSGATHPPRPEGASIGWTGLSSP